MPSPYLLYFTALYSDSRLTSLGGWDTTFENPQRFCQLPVIINARQ
jgi:hypothetical protein